MYLIIGENNVIIHISETIGYQENGNALVDNDALAIAKLLIKEVIEVETVPEGIVPSKYCYTKEEGFYKKPNYREHFSMEQRLSAVEEAINSILGFEEV